MATASSVSKTILSEALTGPNDIESYSTHFELLAELKTGNVLHEKQNFFCIISPFTVPFQRLQEATYRTLPEAT